MDDVAIFYATTSGRSRRLACLIQDAFQPATAELFDLRESKPSDLSSARLLIFGSPTYGTGELHYLWQQWHDRLLAGEVSLHDKEIALFTLGDVKHHRESFAGALGHLHKMIDALGKRPLGWTRLSEPDESAACRSLLAIDGTVPGLILDHVNQRRATPSRIAHWVQQLKQESHLSSKLTT